jgi:hypothetical protein
VTKHLDDATSSGIGQGLERVTMHGHTYTSQCI